MVITPDFMFQIGGAGNLKLKMILVLALVGANCLYNSSPLKGKYLKIASRLLNALFLKWSMLTAAVGCQGFITRHFLFQRVYGESCHEWTRTPKWRHPKEGSQNPFKSHRNPSQCFLNLAINRKQLPGKHLQNFTWMLTMVKHAADKSWPGLHHLKKKINAGTLWCAPPASKLLSMCWCFWYVGPLTP